MATKIEAGDLIQHIHHFRYGIVNKVNRYHLLIEFLDIDDYFDKSQHALNKSEGLVVPVENVILVRKLGE